VRAPYRQDIDPICPRAHDVVQVAMSARQKQPSHRILPLTGVNRPDIGLMRQRLLGGFEIFDQNQLRVTVFEPMGLQTQKLAPSASC
jgi:hypothetical protein